MLDMFLIYFVFLIIFMLTKSSDTSIEILLTQPHISWGMQVGLVVTLWLYFAGFESSPTQATPGKMALGIKVTDLNGQRLSFGRATGRHVGKVLNYITFYIGYLMIFLTKKERGLHDQIAKRLVVNNSPSQAQPSEQDQP